MMSRVAHRLGRWRTIGREVAVELPWLARMPRNVRRFYARAIWIAWRTGDTYSLSIVTRPRDVVTLLRLAEGHDDVIELGTATAWTTVALALADGRRHVCSYDPEIHPERERYLTLAGHARSRIELHVQRAEQAEPAPASTWLVFIDAAHDRDSTLGAYRAFAPAVRPGGAIAFHDYNHPRYPGVYDAVQELGLRSEVRGSVFVWRQLPVPPSSGEVERDRVGEQPAAEGEHGAAGGVVGGFQ